MKTRPTISTMSTAELAMHYQLLDDTRFLILDPTSSTPVEVTSITKDLHDIWVVGIVERSGGRDHLEFRSAEQVVVAIG